MCAIRILCFDSEELVLLLLCSEFAPVRFVNKRLWECCSKSGDTRATNHFRSALCFTSFSLLDYFSRLVDMTITKSTLKKKKERKKRQHTSERLFTVTDTWFVSLARALSITMYCNFVSSAAAAVAFFWSRSEKIYERRTLHYSSLACRRSFFPFRFSSSSAFTFVYAINRPPLLPMDEFPLFHALCPPETHSKPLTDGRRTLALVHFRHALKTIRLLIN